jgi:hypothetical protein
MWKSCLVFILLPLVYVQAQGPTSNNDWNKTRAIKELPFCALIVREFHDTAQANHEFHILMEPDEVTEDNLRLLFAAISRRDPDAPVLVAWIKTDVEQLESLATGVVMAGSGRIKKDSAKRIQQLVLYRRTKEGEFFRYNSNYPKSEGFKTIILWGKEQF